MNIAASNSTTPSATTRPDAVQAAGATPSVADAGDDTASQPTGFGAILSKNIADHVAADGKAGRMSRLGNDPADAAHDPKSATAGDPGLLPPSIGLPTVPVDPTSPDGVAKDVATKDDRPSAADAAGTGVITPGDDLAAQLALVSQWNGLKPRPDAASATDAAPVGALDTQGKLDAVRGAATRPVREVGSASAVDGSAAAIDPATALAATPGLAVDRGPANATRSTATDRATRPVAAALATLAAAAKGASADGDAGPPVDATLLDVARAVAPDTRSATQVADAAPLIAGIAVHASGTDASTVNNFLAQVASQIASQTPAPVVSATAASTDMAAPLAALREPVGTPAWSHEVGQAALRMAANDMQNVSLRLNPEHLGPLDVQMRVDNGIAHLQFSAAHIDTRQALESSRTTLDQMFGNQGIKLGDWSVGQQSSSASFARDFGSANGQGGRRDGSGPADAGGSGDTIVAATIRTIRPLGLVDTFA